MNASTNLLMSSFKLDTDTICVTQKDHNIEKRAQIKSNLILKNIRQHYRFQMNITIKCSSSLLHESKKCGNKRGHSLI